MEAAKARFRAVLTTLLTVGRTHVASVPRLAVLAVVGLAILLLLVLGYARLIGPAVTAQLADIDVSVDSLTALAAWALVPIVIVAVAASLVWIGVVILGADAAAAHRSFSTVRASGVAFRRIPRSFLTILVWLVASLLAIALAPLFTLLGLIGLAVRLLAKHSSLAARLPTTPRLIALAIPFGVAFLVLTRWSLALPALFLDRLPLRDAFLASNLRVTGRSGQVAAVLLTALLISYGVTEGIRALARLLIADAHAADLVGSFLALVLVAALPFVAATVLYRDSVEAGRPADDVAPREGTARSRVAATLVAALIVPVMFVGTPEPAQAAGSTPAYASINPAGPITAGVPATVVITVNGEAPGGEVPTGTLDIWVDDVLLTGPFGPTTFGGAPFELTHTFPAGDHLIEVHYSGDAIFQEADASTTITATAPAGAPSTTTLSVDAPTPIYGNDVTLTATVASAGATPSGSVEFFAAPDGGAPVSLGSQPLNASGVATLVTAQVPAGAVELTAHYSGDSTHAASDSATSALAVAKATTLTSFTIAPSSPSAAGSPLVASVSVASVDSPAVPQGTVSLSITGSGDPGVPAALVDGAVDLPFTLAPGPHSVIAIFTPAPGFWDSQADRIHSVSAFSSTVSLDQSSATTVSGQTFGLTATIAGPPNPGGTVTFEAQLGSDAPIVYGPEAVAADGTATLSSVALPAGSYQMVARYSGSPAVDAADSVALTHVVNKAAVALTVDSPASAPATSVEFGTSVSASAELTVVGPGAGTPTGTVNFLIDGVIVASAPVNASGVAEAAVPSGAGGDRVLTAAYVGDANFLTAGSANSVALHVVPRATSTSLFFSVPAVGPFYGDSLTFTGTVSGGLEPAYHPTGDVELRVDGAVVAVEPLAADGTFSITTNRIIGGVHTVWARYVGDGDFGSSQNSSAANVSLEVDEYESTLALSVITPEPLYGGTAMIAATFPVVGSGPLGGVTFSKVAGGVLGSGALVNGVAQFTLSLTAIDTWVVATYAGDGNYAPATSAPFLVHAERTTASIVLTGPTTTMPYGTVFDLVAVITLGDGSVAEDFVDFYSPPGFLIAEDVPVISGVARVTVCAADTDGCPTGIPLGVGDLNIVADFDESSTHVGAISTPVVYKVVDVATTTTLTVVPTTDLIQGTAVFLEAAVDAPSSPSTPSGAVSFWAVMPLGGGAFGESLLGTAAVELDEHGVARLETVVGDGGGEIRWPASAIIARYFPYAGFDSSTSTVPVTVQRLGVTVDLYVGAVVAHQPVNVQVELTHEPGSSADFLGRVTVTADTGETCSGFVPAGTRFMSCPITFTGVGDHEVSATYAGDLVFEPGNGGPLTVSVGKGTPAFNPTGPGSVTTGENATVNWALFDPAATGTVTVWGDGALWCTVALAVGTCSGQFGLASATGTPVDIVVRYSGDSAWNQVQKELHVLVHGCYTLDVYSTSPSRGTVAVDTPSNCGAGGYLAGTTVSVTATPIAPNQLLKWEKLTPTSPGPVLASTSLTTSFTITRDSYTWVHAATFGLPCLPVTLNGTGYGTLKLVPATNCTSVAGVPGYLLGSDISAFPIGAYNPQYDEKDAFYFFGNVPGGRVVREAVGDPWMSIRVASSPITISYVFGPRCHTVEVTSNPSDPGDVGTATTPTNCDDSRGTIGYLRWTPVTVSLTSSDSSRVVTGWNVDGVAAPELGSSREPTIMIGAGNPVVEAQVVSCYRLDVVIDGAQDKMFHDVGEVTRDVEANCPDGSNRYLAGTQVTLTPKALVDSVRFSGWDDDWSTATAQVGIGPITAAAKVVVIDADLKITASFYYGDTCSRLGIVGDPSLVQVDATGCGPGFYFDAQKLWALRSGGQPKDYWQKKYRSTLSVAIPDDVPLNVYANVRGDLGTCFGRMPAEPGPSSNAGVWQSFGPLARPTTSCELGGDVAIKVEACQTLISAPIFHVEGQPGTYEAGWIPYQVNLPNPTTGIIAPYSTPGLNWAEAMAISVSSAGELSYEGLAPGPCHDAGNAFPADTEIAIYAMGLGQAFRFDGWADGDPGSPLVEANPAVAVTTDDSRTLKVTPSYTIACHTVTFGPNVELIDPVPRCPGTGEADNSFIAGTAIHVKAPYRVGNRTLTTFVSGVVDKQIFEDSITLDQTAYVLVDQGHHVTAEWLTSAQHFGNGVAKGLKITTGLFAVAAPIALGMLFPPAGLFITAMAFGAGIASFIPGGEDVKAAFDLLNPTGITECAARWAFSKPGDPTGGHNVGALVSGAMTARQIYQGKDVLTKPIQNLSTLPILGKRLPKSLQNIPGGLSFALGAASFGYGLYDAGIGGAQFGTQTVDELRGTSNMTDCLDKQWRAVGSDTSGHGDSSGVAP